MNGLPAIDALPCLLGWALVLSLPITAALAAGVEALLGVRYAWTSQTKYRLVGTLFIVAASLPLLIAVGIAAVAATAHRHYEAAPAIVASHLASSAATIVPADAAKSINALPNPSTPSTEGIPFVSRINQIVPFVFWVCLLFAAVRVTMLFWEKRRLRAEIRSCATPAAEDIQHQVTSFAERMSIDKPVAVLACEHNSVPSVFGWRKPVILLSKNARRLPPEQLFPVVIHELAHVRRNDVLLIPLQALVRAVFTLDLAINWLSVKLNRLSEECCDDIACSVWGDTRQYAAALLRFAELDAASPAALGVRHGSLEWRITRLLKPEEARRTRYRPVAAGLLIFVAASLIAALGLRNVEAASRALESFQSSIIIDVEMKQAAPRVDRRAIRWTDLTNQGTSKPITVPLDEDGYVAFEVPLHDTRTFIIRPHRLGPMAIQVRSLIDRHPLVRTEWISMRGKGADTDAGSGRGGACLLVVDCDNPEEKWVRCRIKNSNKNSSPLMVTAWQPTTGRDRDPDVVGQASSLMVLDNFNRAQIPTRPNERAPAMDRPGDIDTFQVWPSRPGKLTVAIDGFRGQIRPYCYAYDNDGKLIHAGPDEESGTLYRFSLQGAAGYYLAISSRDQTATGEYMIVVHFDAD